MQSPNKAYKDVFDKEQALTLGKTTSSLKNDSMIKERPRSNSKEQEPAYSQTYHKAQGYSFLSKSSLLLSSRP